MKRIRNVYLVCVASITSRTMYHPVSRVKHIVKDCFSCGMQRERSRLACEDVRINVFAQDPEAGGTAIFPATSFENESLVNTVVGERNNVARTWWREDERVKSRIIIPSDVLRKDARRWEYRQRLLSSS